MTIHQDIKGLVSDLKKLYFWQKWFLPKPLRQIINSSTSSDFIIYKVCSNQLWFFHKWFKCIRKFTKSHTMAVLEEVKSEGFFNDDKAQAKFDALLILDRTGLLNLTHRNMIATHANPEDVVAALRALDNENMLTEEARGNFYAITGHANPQEIAPALIILHKTKLLNEPNREAVIRANKPVDIAIALEAFRHNILFTLHRIQNFFDALVTLDRTNLLTQANIDTIAKHPNSYGITEVLKIFHDENLLTADNAQAIFDATAKHRNPLDVVYAIVILRPTGLANRDTLVEYPDPVAIAQALLRLHDNMLLNGDRAQASFAAIAKHAKPLEVADALIYP